MHQQRLGQIRKWTTMQWQLLRCNNWGSLNSICNLHKTLFIFSKEFILFKSFTHVLELVMWVCGMPPWFVPTQQRGKIQEIPLKDLQGVGLRNLSSGIH